MNITWWQADSLIRSVNLAQRDAWWRWYKWVMTDEKAAILAEFRPIFDEIIEKDKITLSNPRPKIDWEDIESRLNKRIEDPETAKIMLETSQNVRIALDNLQKDRRLTEEDLRMPLDAPKRLKIDTLI